MGRIIGYKQRLEWQISQRKAMDKHLVHLVRQTEQYAGDLAERMNKSAQSDKITREGGASHGASMGPTTSDNSKGTQKNPRTRHMHDIEISEGEYHEASENGLSLSSRLAVADACARQADAARPFLLDSTVRLRPYQQAGLNWLVSMHERQLNGILADEMGLGKTLQTISLLAHLAAHKGLWGPHLVVVPTSCLVNWESELKRFCPGFKIVTYYGAAKARKQLRTGWSKASAVHVVVTSYQLAVQDASIFRRKKFYYLILDEAHNIKNFDSRRWRTLLAFQAQRRLLLTGTPLQNSLMELWSLMHFLMPHIFRSRHEFSYWFANPLQGAVEGKSKMSEELVRRLHSIMRPFVLRRLKKDVAKQLPGKFEHDVPCRLSRRQQLLYEEFMARSSTRCAMERAPSGSNFVSMMNVVMQLRKVCNHPDLFEPRPIVAPLVLPNLVLVMPSIVSAAVVDITVNDIGGSVLCQAKLDEDPMPLESVRHLLAPVNFVHEARRPMFLEDINLSAELTPQALLHSLALHQRHLHAAVEQDAARVLSRHVAKCALIVGATAPSNVSFSTRAFLARNFRYATPMNTAWRAVTLSGNNVSDSSRVYPTDDWRRLQANRHRFASSRTLRHQLESCATLSGRYQNLNSIIRRFAFAVSAAVSPAPILILTLPFSSAFPIARASTPRREPHADDVIACCAYVSAGMRPIHHVALALRVSFPDRSLIQWDSGKFHELAPLLRRLKNGAHRCLIFTQMSKMLDVLESFLCWHGHSYLRLDGGTPPGERQRLMDRFNSDAFIFCFVLSTRSGGLGINLTGADTVIFYDSDWNPAMDAQAMDRAHRIGQTRDVHIYRLICIATVEENILLKARQKQKLEFITLTEGNFDSIQLQQKVANDRASGLRDILSTQSNNTPEVDIAATLAELEDVQDVAHARAAAAEVATAAREFDESTRTDLDPGIDDENAPLTSLELKNPEEEAAREVAAMEAEFAAWQERAGPDPEALTKSLSVVERQALTEHESRIITLPSGAADTKAFLTLSERRLMETIEKENAGGGPTLDVNEVEYSKQIEERRACSEGELLATDIYFVDDTRGSAKLGLDEHEFLKRRRLALLAKCNRECTGAAWETRIDAVTSDPFWYNVDTAEATWLKPLVIQRRDADAEARRGGYGNWPKNVAARVTAMCEPRPTRCACALVCRNWAKSCAEDHLLVKVLPVEQIDGCPDHNQNYGVVHPPTKMDVLKRTHDSFPSPKRPRSFSVRDCSGRNQKIPQSLPVSKSRMSLRSALEAALPGETLVLGPGHYWEDGADLIVEVDVRVIGDVTMPDRVVIELGGALCWRAHSGALVGLTLRRPRACTEATSALMIKNGFVACHRIIVDNLGSGGAAIVVRGGPFPCLECALKRKYERTSKYRQIGNRRRCWCAS